MAAIEEGGEEQGTATSAGRTADRRAISGPLTPVTSGLSRSLADTPPCRSGHITSPDGTDSQADSAGSIPVTRSTLKAQVRWSPASAVDSVLEGPLYSEIVRPGLDADNLDEAFSALEVVWVGRVERELVTGCRRCDHQV
jgi:hypothetical protein